MIINSIKLLNIGPYEGNTIFDTKTEQGKNIILIGGKNGAGKTTLFTSIRICLYGYRSLGYKNFGAGYSKAVTKLINDHAKLTKPTNAFVELEIILAGQQSNDEYILKREWSLSEALSESFSVYKNGQLLTEEEKDDFEKYLMNIIPAELFDLYFFDGESIADYFLSEGNNKRIKEAFLTLCGYDTFDIMEKQFKRVAASNKVSNNVLNDYVKLKEEYELAVTIQHKIEEKLASLEAIVTECNDSITHLDEQYQKSGGITLDEWNKKLAQVREEEKRRETLNAFLKKATNDILPFVIIREQLSELGEQIKKENSGDKYSAFTEVLNVKAIKKYLNKLSPDAVKELNELALSEYGVAESKILDLSFEQSSDILVKINFFNTYDIEEIRKAKREIKTSIGKTARLRDFLENHSVDSVEHYSVKRGELLEKKTNALNDIVAQDNLLIEATLKVSSLIDAYDKAKNALEENIKKSSINDISAKALLMLDKLQKKLYDRQVKVVEENFMDALGRLMRKEHLVDEIFIDEDFNVHVYKNEAIPGNQLQKALIENDEGNLVALYGQKAYSALLQNAKADNLDGIRKYYTSINSDVVLPIEKDKQNFSKGEKQILIMALYFALVKLGNHNVPFVIDTPFARIDTEHRENISEHFFSCLNGQVFILSTNEEIDSEHVQILKDKIGKEFLLENKGDLSTRVVDGAYFGGNDNDI